MTRGSQLARATMDRHGPGRDAPPAAFLVLNFIEDQLVLPFLLGRWLALNPVVIFVWVLFWAWMWGIGGLLLAVPLLVAARIFLERVPLLNPLAIVFARSPERR